MYIQPNSTIKLLSGVPLDPNQTDTLWFESTTKQYQYFNSKVILGGTFNELTYQRVNKGVCRLQVLADNIYNVNYMMFQNTSYGNKWFYAFVDKIEYINNITTEITFTIDPMQTWFFNYEIGECFVEREIVNNDSRGIHFEPENMNVGEYLISDYQILGNDFSETSIIVALASAVTGEQTQFTGGKVYDGVYSGLLLKQFKNDENGRAELRAFIQGRTQDKLFDEIVNIYMCPTAIITIASGTTTLPETLEPKEISDSFDGLETLTDIDGYVPFNQKLFTYPFNFCFVDTPDGNSQVYRYELFYGQPSFRIRGNITTPVEITCKPKAYKIKRNTTPSDENRNEGLTLKGFPLCGWSKNYYSDWLAQNSIPRTAQAINTAISSVGSFLVRPTPVNFGMQGINAISTAIDMISDDRQASTHANVFKGSLSTGSCDFASKNMNFKYGRMHITNLMAKRIDGFFTAFGYNVGLLKKPTRYNRTRFTYVKTQGANVGGDLPSSDAKYIADCYDRGIRFWSDVEHVNNYDMTTYPNIPVAVPQ